MQGVAFADSREDTLDDRGYALAVSWALERKLPCKQLRFIAGTLDEHRDFDLRLADLELAEAERAVFAAKISRTRILEGDEAANAMYPENDELFERYRARMLDMANTRVHTRADLRRKRSAIGEVWLRAAGPWYDQLRAAVAADETRLAPRRR
jgi:hypothetical protein